jgi:enoyl-CoA hydratase
MSTRLRTSIEGGVARVTIDDGKVNAMSAALLGEIGEALDDAERAAAVVVMSGREGIFSAGFDLPTFQAGADATLEMLRGGVSLIDRLLRFPLPVATVCTGHAYPMGAFLMMAADVRLATAGPWRIGMNEVAIGLTVPRFAVELARHRLTPAGFARVTTAAMFEPEEARRLGYLDRVVDPSTLAQAVDEEVVRLRALDPASFVATKARVNEHVVGAVREAAADELQMSFATGRSTCTATSP